MATPANGRRKLSGKLAAAMDGLFIVLLKVVPPSPDVEDAWADVSEADFSGYARGTWSFDPPATRNSADKGESKADIVTFTHDGGVTANSIVGWGLIDTEDGTTLLHWDEFDAPIDLTDDGDEINLRVKQTLTQDDT